MAYELRERKSNGVYAYYDYSSEEETPGNRNNGSHDPDYSRRGSSNRRTRAPTPAPTPRIRRKLSAQEAPSTSSSTLTETDEKNIISWLLKKGELSENEAVCLYVRGVARGEGVVKGEAIFCRCCGKTFTASEFEIHAGIGSQRPYEKIIVARTNSSLLEHFMRAWNKGSRTYNCFVSKSGPGDGSDNVCLICAGGGNLMCCDLCPSTFHLGCVGMQVLPEEKWYCLYCKCKYCGNASEDKLTCSQCAKPFHFECFRANEDFDLNSKGMGQFCGLKCREVGKKIKGLLGETHSIQDGYTWSLIKRMEACEIVEDNHKWMDCNGKVALAFEVLNEGFLTTVDNYTGINILESVVKNKGSNLERMNFKGFHTLILLKNDAIISAATLRIHDGELAEMPYVATRTKYRRNGMLQMIFKAVTKVLSNAGIKNLVIPAIEDVAEMWKKKYEFVPLDNEMKRKLINYNTLVFPGTIRLQKTIAGNSTSAMELGHNFGAGSQR